MGLMWDLLGKLNGSCYPLFLMTASIRLCSAPIIGLAQIKRKSVFYNPTHWGFSRRIVPDIPLITGPFLLSFIPGCALGQGLADKLEFREYATNQVIRLIEPAKGAGVRAHTVGSPEDSMWQIRIVGEPRHWQLDMDTKTAGDVPAFCLQPSLQQTWMGFISAQCLAVEAPRCQLTAYWLTSLLRWYSPHTPFPCYSFSLLPPLFVQVLNVTLTDSCSFAWQ